jgi:hypothetical protein
MFITGRGNRSVGGVAKVKPAIIGLLKREGVKIDEDNQNEGVVIGVLPEGSKNNGWGCIVM